MSSTNFYFNFELFVPLLGLTWNIEVYFCFVETGWFPIRILDTYIFSPIYELLVQMAYPMKIIEEDICFVEIGWFPIRILDNFRFSLIYELSVQMAYPMRILEEDKAIEIRSETIRTRLGC